MFLSDSYRVASPHPPQLDGETTTALELISHDRHATAVVDEAGYCIPASCRIKHYAAQSTSAVRSDTVVDYVNIAPLPLSLYSYVRGGTLRSGGFTGETERRLGGCAQVGSALLQDVQEVDETSSRRKLLFCTVICTVK